MSFAVNKDAVVCNLISGEYRARIASRKNPEKKELYRNRRVMDTTPAITRFIQNHQGVFSNRKLIHSDGTNFFGEIVPLASLAGTESHKEMLKSRLKYEYDLSDEELPEMDRFIEDLYRLNQEPEIQSIVNETRSYKNSIERIWRLNEASVMRHIKSVLGTYEPETSGKVSTYIMYPNFDTHRSYQLTGNKTFLFFAKSGESNPNKIIASLAHQAVHQPMLPYKSSMTKKEKDEFHAFIKFLTDKDIYNQFSGESYLDIVTQGENAEVMGRVYPFWLGYRYRNVDKEGLDPVEEIEKAINRDKNYFDKLPINSKKRKLYEKYEFEKLDPEKIAKFFKARRAITPYEFAKLDFEDKQNIYQDRYLEDITYPMSGVR